MYCSATSQAFIGRRHPWQPPSSAGKTVTTCAQIGGWNSTTSHAQSAITAMPTPLITKKAGPSAGSAKPKSRPQRSQLLAMPRKLENNAPSPQRGQRQRRPALSEEGPSKPVVAIAEMLPYNACIERIQYIANVWFD